MIAFMVSLCMNANGWESLLGENKKLKSKRKWMPTEQELVQQNFKTLYAIFNEENATAFRRINTYKSAQEVWNILKTTHERTIAVKMSKIQKLIKDFKNLTMKDDEFFNDFYGKLNNIVNTSFKLEEKMS